jgi:hypothetical protein
MRFDYRINDYGQRSMAEDACMGKLSNRRGWHTSPRDRPLIQETGIASDGRT